MRMLDTNSPKMKSTSSPQGLVRPKMMGLVEKVALLLKNGNFWVSMLDPWGVTSWDVFFSPNFLGVLV